jgi:glycyl-tRNA synthetase beta chain
MAVTAIAAGNARVLSARLSDARHFWDLDRKTGLEAMASELARSPSTKSWARWPTRSSASPGWRANWRRLWARMPSWPESPRALAKADLVSQMVYEFPELQGAMGRY